MDLGLHVLDGVGGFNLKGDGLASQGFHKDLHTSSQSQNQVKSGLLLDVVVGQGPSIFQLLSSKDQTLLIGRDPFLVLDLGLHVLDGVGGFNLKGDGLTSQCLHEDLHRLKYGARMIKNFFFYDEIVDLFSRKKMTHQNFLQSSGNELSKEKILWKLLESSKKDQIKCFITLGKSKD